MPLTSEMRELIDAFETQTIALGALEGRAADCRAARSALESKIEELEAKKTHLMDMYRVLGVEWGHDIFAAIWTARRREATNPLQRREKDNG